VFDLGMKNKEVLCLLDDHHEPASEVLEKSHRSFLFGESVLDFPKKGPPVRFLQLHQIIDVLDFVTWLIGSLSLSGNEPPRRTGSEGLSFSFLDGCLLSQGKMANHVLDKGRYLSTKTINRERHSWCSTELGITELVVRLVDGGEAVFSRLEKVLQISLLHIWHDGSYEKLGTFNVRNVGATHMEVVRVCR